MTGLTAVLTGRRAGLLAEETDKRGYIGHADLFADHLHRLVRFRQQAAGFLFAQGLGVFQNTLAGAVLKEMRQIGRRQIEMIRHGLQGE